MPGYEELAALAKICARQAHVARTKEAAAQLWLMAQQYRADAAKLDHGRSPEIGEPPLWS